MKKEELEIHLIEIEALIRAGKNEAARTSLLKIKKKTEKDNPPRDLRLRLAVLARRMGLPDLTIKLLGSIVHPTGRKVFEATTVEKAHYAAALVKIGASHEALQLLDKLNYKEMPEILLFKSFAHFSVWDYHLTIPLLETYIETPGLSDYQREIGRTNLAAALVHEKDPRAIEVLNTLIEHSKKQGYSLLVSNAYRFMSEFYFIQGKYEEAQKALDIAADLGNKKDSNETLFISKWQALINLYQSGGSKASLDKLDEVRKNALDKRHWETIRACDYYEAIFLQNKELCLQLYFGTPFDSFKKSLLADFKGDFDIPENFAWKSSVSQKTKIDESLVDSSFKERLGHQRLLLILASDFYKPQRVATLHHFLYPDEYYNSASSPVRIRKAISRLRELILKERLPVAIEKEGGAYRMVVKTGHALIVPRDKKLARSLDALIGEIKFVYKEESFTSRQASEVLKMNIWTTIELLGKARDENLIVKIGSGNKIFYVVASLLNSENKAA